jgi:hypothetical protein
LRGEHSATVLRLLRGRSVFRGAVVASYRKISARAGGERLRVAARRANEGRLTHAHPTRAWDYFKITGAQPHTMPSWRSTSAAVAVQLFPDESQVVVEGNMQPMRSGVGKAIGYAFAHAAAHWS